MKGVIRVAIKPMLFNTEMVQAILEGRKTVTRRVIKPQPESRLILMGPDSCWPGYFAIQGTEKVVRPPFCAGDVIWVRETFQVDYLSNIIGSGRVRYKTDGVYQDVSFAPERHEIMRNAQKKSGWRPNENMPKEAARIFLRVTDVRAERLQEITAEGALDEGTNVEFPEPKPSYISLAYTEMRLKPAARQSFANLWDSTIKPADRPNYGWEANPYVWVIEFERCEKP